MATIGQEMDVDTSTPVVQHTLYVLVPPSPLFAAHWSFFIPEMLPYDSISKRHEEAKTGRRIHVSGDRLNGFELEIVRDYDIRKHRSVGSRKFPVAAVAFSALQKCDIRPPTISNQKRRGKDDDEGGGYIDNEPIDAFEQVCIEVDPPGPSLNSVKADMPAGNGITKKLKREVRDCQWWVRKVIEVLMSKNMLETLAPELSQQSTDIHELVARLPSH